MSIRIEGYVVTVSMRAILFHGHYWTNPEWLPFSQITVTVGDGEHIVDMSNWIAGQKGIREFRDRGADKGIPQEQP